MAKTNKANDMELLARMDERQKAQDEKLDAILIQTIKTNGRVSILEKWKNYLVGGGLVIITIIGWLITK